MHAPISVLDDPVISSRVFYPRPATQPPTFPVTCDGLTLACRRRVVDPDAGYVVYFHGNGELASECDAHVASIFTDAGFNVCFVEYRGYGGSEGNPALVAMLADGEGVVAALGVPPGRVVAFGRSLGSVYAIELARRLPTLGGLILESGIADFAEQLSFATQAAQLGCPPAVLTEAVAAHLDHKAKLAVYFGPVLVMHAGGDSLVEPSHGRRLHEWAGGADKKLVLFPRGGHNDILSANVVQYQDEVRGFLRRVL